MSEELRHLDNPYRAPSAVKPASSHEGASILPNGEWEKAGKQPGGHTAALTAAFRHWAAQLGTAARELRGVLFLCSGDGATLSECLLDGGNDCTDHPPLMKDSDRRNRLAADGHGADRCRSVSAVPFRLENGETAAFIGIEQEEGELREEDMEALYAASVFFLPCFRLAVADAGSRQLEDKLDRAESDFAKSDVIFRAVQRLISLGNVNHILSEAVTLARELYPEAAIDLLLSQDDAGTGMTVRPINIFQADNDLCTRAYMEGKLMVGQPERGRVKEVASPLAGKQGVYGVLHFRLKKNGFSAADQMFIGMIAAAAGTAFENGRLYEQSILLVRELKLINEITKRLNQSLKLSEIFQFAMFELLHIFDAEFCCILQLDKPKGRFVVEVSNLPALEKDTYGKDEGFSGLVTATKEPVIVLDYAEDNRTPSKLMQLTGSRSLLASPIFVGGEVAGVILLAHRQPHFFTYENYKLLFVLSGPIGLAVSNASLHAEVNRMVITDNLTGLYTRRYLDEHVSLHQGKGTCGSLILVDVDDFKQVNDTYGHQAGDKTLIQVSNIVRNCIRDSDIAARWGGEELAVYLPQIEAAQAVKIAERIRKRVCIETEPGLTVSCGISDWHTDDDKISVESLFYRSDMALYRAKGDGKNRIMTG